MQTVSSFHLEMGGAERCSTAWHVCHAALLTPSLGCQLVNANGEHHSTRVKHTLRVKHTAKPQKDKTITKLVPFALHSPRLRLKRVAEALDQVFVKNSLGGSEVAAREGDVVISRRD